MSGVRRAATVLALVLLGAGVSWAQVADWPSERPPRPLAARDVKFPPYALKTLGNGLQVIAVSHHEQPAVSVRLMVRAGGAQDPADKPGVAALAAALLDQGTKSRTAEQIQHSIDSIGGVIGAGSGTEYTFVQAIVMKDSFNVGLDMVSDIAKNPAFVPQEIELQRKQMLSTLTVSYDDPEYLAGVVFERLVYGAHPLRANGLRNADVARGHHAQRPGRLSPGVVRREQRDSRHRRRRHRRRGIRRGGTRLRGLAEGLQSRAAHRRAAGARPPARHHRSAGRRADGNSRRKDFVESMPDESDRKEEEAMTSPTFEHHATFPLPVARDAAFRALVEPDQLERWFAEHVRIAARVGGAFTFHGRGALGSGQTITALRSRAALLAFGWTLYDVPTEVCWRVSDGTESDTSTLEVDHRVFGRPARPQAEALDRRSVAPPRRQPRRVSARGRERRAARSRQVIDPRSGSRSRSTRSPRRCFARCSIRR